MPIKDEIIKAFYTFRDNPTEENFNKLSVAFCYDSALFCYGDPDIVFLNAKPGGRTCDRCMFLTTVLQSSHGSGWCALSHAGFDVVPLSTRHLLVVEWVSQWEARHELQP